jgi:hypothetical protein
MHSNNIEIFTIHDAFAIPFNKIETLIISAWDSIEIDEKIIKKTKIKSLSILC